MNHAQQLHAISGQGFPVTPKVTKNDLPPSPSSLAGKLVTPGSHTTTLVNRGGKKQSSNKQTASN
jgi:hypothetical protein